MSPKHLQHPRYATPQQWARDYFDAYGDKEWYRLDSDLSGIVSFEMHLRMIKKYVTTHQNVLEVGAGPGRFTRELCARGASITVSDLSPEQLRLNAKYVGSNLSLEQHVKERLVLDVCDCSIFPPSSFDTTICIGGPISYVFDNAPTALSELIRVTKPGSVIIVSVMSLFGGIRVYLPSILEQMQTNDLSTKEFNSILQTGDIPPHDASHHACRLYTYERLEALIQASGCTILEACAANMLTSAEELKTHAYESYRKYGSRKDLSELLVDSSFHALLEWEYAACHERGNFDSGTHIIVAFRTPESH